jgi:ABC-type multidrug transport system fused ATPase/permease subunit
LDGSITAGDLTGFIMYSLLMAGNLSGLTSLYGDMVRAVAASNRVFDILDREPSIKAALQEMDTKADPLKTTKFQPTKMSYSNKAPLSVELLNVNFQYPSRSDVEVLKNFTLSIDPGQVVALVGGSGSGKSTVASLLTRLYDVDKPNSILINGQSINEYDPHELRRMIGIVSQEPAIFQGTIRDNIRYGEWDHVSDEQVEEAARLAHILDFAKDFPDGLDTVVGSRGSKLSGGQRQRLALARVLAKNPPLVILDEATSALDAQSEHLVQLAMNCVMSGRTVLSIAHRLSTIRHADVVCVVGNGSVVQTGTFEELSAGPGPFRELMKTQLVGDLRS